jgi:alkanesulfonate monooxygenase SsuD/methylene tetrahydromethanopterin reductase-like flavin-dependent oxidoreductase (luciferase family)
MDRAEYRGRFFSFGGVRAEPRPIQEPHPPIVFGGKTTHAFSRTARLGDGWFGYGLDLDSAANCIASIRDACTKHGRSFDEIEISVTPKAELDHDLVRRYADLGVRRLIVSPRARDVDEMVAAIRNAERTVIAKE